MHDPAVYAGSFDPPTNGHVWMIEKAATLFDRVVVAVAENPEKRYTFGVEERRAWLEEVCRGRANVEVAVIQNQFLARFAEERGCRFIVRGIRNEADYGYERAMRYINSDLAPGMTSVFLMPPRALCEVSSSFVKGMVGPAGWERVVRAYVPGCVFEGLVAWGQVGREDLGGLPGIHGDES